MHSRNETRSFKIGALPIGGGAPVSVQSMANAEPHDAEALVRQVESCAALGCVMGMIMLALLALVGARSTASGANLLLYHVLWLLPVLVGTSSAAQGG